MIIEINIEVRTAINEAPRAYARGILKFLGERNPPKHYPSTLLRQAQDSLRVNEDFALVLSERSESKEVAACPQLLRNKRCRREPELE